MSSGKVHVNLKCWGMDCNFVYDYVRQTSGNYVCTLPGTYSKTALRLRIYRKKKKKQEIQINVQDILECPKCARKLWILEVPPPSSLIFLGIFKDVNVYVPKDMETEEEKSKKSETQKPHAIKPVERFLDIDNSPTDVYRDLVNEINFCFANQAYAATIVLTRKLLENLIVDILRKKYGMPELALFYIPSKHKFKGLSELIFNLRTKLADFDAIGLKTRHITTIEKLREEGNSNAHSVLDHATKEELVDIKSAARKAVKTLLSVRESLF